MSVSHSGNKALVLGGSVAGLTTALLLRDCGFDVTVFERTPTDLSNRGGGIVIQPDTFRWFAERSARKPETLRTFTEYLRYLGENNNVVHEEPVEWSYSSWGGLYRALLSDFGRDRYVLGEFAVGFSQDNEHVQVRFVSGRVERAELVVFADGISSVGRNRLNPGTSSVYSGYIGWRGTVPERELSDETRDLLGDALAYSVGQNTHICMYPIPGPKDSTHIGGRDLNYVWYRNVSEGPELDEMLVDKQGIPRPISVHAGQVQDRYVDEMKQAVSGLLAPAAAELVEKTSQPYIQAIADIRSDRMVSGRVAVLGDAAFAARPHGAAGTAKAAADAWALAEALEATQGDIVAALAAWEPRQLALGNSLVDRVAEMGNRSQFHNTWVPGDPGLQFGLYGPGILTRPETASP